MKQLTEENFELCQRYLNMIDGIEEGFAYVIASFTDFSKMRGELVLSDILQALTSIAHANTVLEQLFADDELIQQAIVKFKDVTDAAFELDGYFNQYDTKNKIINDSLYPSFSTWKVIIQNALSRYVTQ